MSVRAPIRLSPFASLVVSVLAIVVCGGVGASLGYSLVRALGWDGVGAALLAALVGMVAAVMVWALGVLILRRVGWLS